MYYFYEFVSFMNISNQQLHPFFLPHHSKYCKQCVTYEGLKPNMLCMNNFLWMIACEHGFLCFTVCNYTFEIFVDIDGEWFCYGMAKKIYKMHSCPQRKGASFCIYVCGGKHFDKPCLHTQVYGCRFASRHVIYIDSVGSILIYILLSYEGINRSYISFIFIYTPVSCEGVHRC